MSRQLSIGEKLTALDTVSLRSGISHADYYDIKMWVALAGTKHDTSALHEKSLERIMTLYDEHFLTEF